MSARIDALLDGAVGMLDTLIEDVGAGCARFRCAIAGNPAVILN